MATTYPSQRPSRPYQERRDHSPRPYVRRDTPYVERNDPLPPKDPAEVKAKPQFPEVTFEQAFARQQVGHFVIVFMDEEGVPFKAKNSLGYLTIKPRGHAAMTGYFQLTGPEGPLASLPEKKPFLRAIDNSFKVVKDAKLTHVHYNPS